MVRQELISIASCANTIEADQLRASLMADGIVAFVGGGHASTMLGQVGDSIGGVKVFVGKEDVAEATRILHRRLSDVNLDASPWFCAACQQIVDGTFELCWSCCGPRRLVEGMMPALASEESSPLVADDLPSTVRSGFDDMNPYATLLEAEQPLATPEPLDPTAAAEIDAILRRAWRAAIVANVLLPVVLHFYSMYLLLHAAIKAQGFSAANETRFYVTFVVNLIGGILWGIYILSR